jgi:hypothetical protein
MAAHLQASEDADANSLLVVINFGCSSQAIAPDAARTPDAKFCDLIGCADAFRATVTSGASGFPVGMHQIDVTADGATLS